MLATLAAALWLIVPGPQTYEWEPATGPVAGYEVELRWQDMEGAETRVERRQVKEAGLTVQPVQNEAVTLRTRARSQVEDWPPGEWSEWSEPPIGTRNNPDTTGDTVVGMPDFWILQDCWGCKIEDGRIVR